MKRQRKLAVVLAAIMLALAAFNAASCGNEPQTQTTDGISPSPGKYAATDPATDDPIDEPPETTDPISSPALSPIYPGLNTPSPAYPGPDVPLTPYNGDVEHIFFHEAIAYPELAFDGDSEQRGFDNNMVTVSEYVKILTSLYEKNYILVDLNDVWSEYTDENGAQKMHKNTLMLPEGKKPIVISFDDISFYKYMLTNGFMHKLIIGEDGDIWAVGVDPDGSEVITQDLAVVPILDKFVREHPDFSLGGVKGCIALTGYEGILGYRTQYDAYEDSSAARLNRLQEVARVRPVIARLKETGWYFASHSYGHIPLQTETLENVKADAQRWMEEVGSLIGETSIFLYPYGARLDGDDVYNTGPAFLFYHDLGFRIFASVGFEPFYRIKPDIAAVVCDRISIDGIRLRNNDSRYLRFYNAREIFDPARPSEYAVNW